MKFFACVGIVLSVRVFAGVGIPSKSPLRNLMTRNFQFNKPLQMQRLFAFYKARLMALLSASFSFFFPAKASTMVNCKFR
jgi:hypothetical protein